LLDKARVLVVEDDEGIRMTLEDLLASEGCAVESRSDGPSGEAAARSGGYDIVLLDLMLPGIAAQLHDAAIVARVAPGDGVDGDQIAAHGNFRLVIHLQPDIALSLAGGHVVARHAAGLKVRVGQRGNGAQTRRKDVRANT